MPDRIILFDGVCNFCSASVRFVIRHDPYQRFRFAALQSEAGQRLAQIYGFQGLESMVLIEHGQVYRKSSAVLKIVRQFGCLWPLLYAFAAVPEIIRDYGYDFIGSRRYQWFGKMKTCWQPKQDIKDRFLR